jgi:uncharacterized RDD family membrane protein YckC
VTTFRDYRRTHDVEDGITLQTLPVAARALQGERAGFFTRAIAAVIDVVVVGAIMIGIWIAVWLFLLVFNPLVDYGMPRPGYFVLGGYFLMWLYWTWTWTTSGRSLGQNLMGVRVLDRRGGRPSWKVAAVRSAFCVVFQVGILWILVSRRNRSVQDVVLRTSVVHDWSTGTSTGQVAPLAQQRDQVADQQSQVQGKAERIAAGIDRVLHPRKGDKT